MYQFRNNIAQNIWKEKIPSNATQSHLDTNYDEACTIGTGQLMNLHVYYLVNT